jgi:pimeloyl-ACP methyl ester carboxylesterase
MALETLPLATTFVRGGIEIHHAEAGAGPALVFVHGGFGDWRSWAPQWSEFVSHYRCISYSRRFSVPNRNATLSADHSVLVEADDLDELLDAWGAAPAILVGTSYGAYTALALALKSPHKVRSLVIAEPPVMGWADRTPGGREVRLAFEREVLMPAELAFQRGETEHAVLLLTEGINGSAPSSAHTPLGRARRLENARAMRLLLNSNEPFPQLDETQVRRLDKPTLLIAGVHTQPIHDAIYRALCGVMPQAEHVRIPDCGHGAHRDNPAAFNEVVLGFLRNRLA